MLLTQDVPGRAVPRMTALPLKQVIRSGLRVAAVSLCLAGCAAPSSTVGTAPHEAGSLPGHPRLGSALPAGHTRYDNAWITDAFVRLTHDLEWGQRRPHLLRYEEPINIVMSGPGAAGYTSFVDAYLAELRTRAGVAIGRAPGSGNLLVRFVPGADFRAQIPKHSCVVAPGRLEWETFRRDPTKFGTRAFERQRSLQAMTVFIPANAEPYLIRTCLIEEIAQALGPANDLYELSFSIFNDDAVHLWPTALDYLMLRVLYSPQMRSGLSRGETRRVVRSVLAQLNPIGERAPPQTRINPNDMREWSTKISAVFERSPSAGSRRRSANQALAIAIRRRPGSAFHCQSLVTLARVSRDEPAAELGFLERAERICARVHGSDDLRIALIKLSRARALFRAGRPSAALGLSEGLESRLASHGKAERLVSLYALQEAALRAIQQGSRSFAARRLAAEWGAYALGRRHPEVRRLIGN